MNQNQRAPYSKTYTFITQGYRGFPHGIGVKNPPANAGDSKNPREGSISWSGRSPEGGNGNQLQYSCLENPMNRGAWWATIHRVTKESDTTEAT